ncbi:transcriptional regulator [Sporosarcina sp. P12(2017)]|uniref:ArsR/SmtB family transcription factor n=1 Tax=unclassified Sporosarcina TaxID=2647733 RepID=UPI000C171CBF|nr:MULTISPECIES: metalloregulator ArsR/SmtB family transcription factor [unclassified Sporosarcina]PIC56696.1 transcriptional regulator [Sporosarcina sp. P10]PIC59913.1 transcriptional regulator [Sporosarcina sp. P12(2017)]
MIQENFELKVKFLRAFGDKTRVQILECIKYEEKTVSQIVESIDGNQSNISQHLACLRGCGIIVGRQEGKYIYYGLRNQQIKELLDTFDQVLNQIENNVACCENHIS